MNLREKALRLAFRAHAGQRDKGGKPYIQHPLRVASAFADETRYAVALLHDVAEDSGIIMADLLEKGFPAEIADAVDAITKRPDENYEDYLTRVKANPIARDVKIADIRHNMQIDRIPTPGPQDYERLGRYRQALKYLQD